MANEVNFKIKITDDGGKVLRELTVEAGNADEAIGKIVQSAKRATDELQQMAARSITLGNITTAIGQVNDAFQGLISTQQSFDASMRAVNTMAGKSEKEFQDLKASVADLGKEIPKTREELSDGLYQVISNGVPEDNWISFLNKSARASVGGIADLGQTVTVTSTIIKNYGMEWEAAGDIQDKIQMTAKNGVTSFEQLAQALPRVSGNAATLGVSIDELMASFATLTGVSGNTAEVSTQLAAIFTALIKPSSEAATMAQQMGIQFDAAAIKAAGGMRNFLTQLNQDVEQYAAAHGMLEQEIYAKLFGSAEALRALIPLNGELADKFGENIDAMANSAGTIDDAFDQMASTGDSATQMLKNQIAALTDWIGELAGSAGPSVAMIANISMAITSGMQLTMTLRTATSGLKAFAAAHVLAAAKTALSTVATKARSIANAVYTASNYNAAVATGVLTAAVVALYAALTMGISVIITGLAALFGTVGDEAEEAAEKIDILKESTDAFSNASAQAQSEIEMEKVKLQDLIKTNGNAKSTIEELNRKYGESMGYHQTAAEWYDTLVAKSKVYCQQLGYEAQAKVIASQIAAKELEKQNALATMSQLGGQQMDSQGRVTYNYDHIEGGKEQYEQASAAFAQADADLARLQSNFDICVSKMTEAQKELAATTKKTTQTVDWHTQSYADLGKAIEEQKTKVAGLAGVNDAQAKKEAATLRQMEARYKALGQKYGLATSSTSKGGKDPFDGKKLIANAQSYKELGNNIKYYQDKLDKCKPTETAAIAEYSQQIRLLQEKQAAIKAVMEEAGLPVELDTLARIDEAIAFQRSLRSNASQENLAEIDAEIERLNALRTAFEENAHAPVPIDQITTYQEISNEISHYEKRLKTATSSERAEIQKQIKALKELQAVFDEQSHTVVGIDQIHTYQQLEDEISFYETKLKRCTETERAEVQKQINELHKLRSEWDNTIDALQAPEDISRLNTIEQLEQAISYYSTQQKRQSAEEIANTQKTILALEKKRDALTRLVSIPSMQQEVGELEGLKGKKLRLELEAIGLDGIKNKIRDLQKMLDDTKNPLGDEERKNVMGLVSAYKSYENALKKSQIKLQDAWGSIKGIGNGVENITDALEGNGNAWQKVTAIIDGVIQIYEGFNTIISIIQTLTAISTAHAAAKTVEATTETTESATLAENATVAVSAAAATTAANALATASWSALAAAMTFAAHAEIPFAGTAIAAGFVATQQAIIAACSIPKFANGAIAYGPTLGLFGEYSGASTNPEVVAPLDKLQSLLDIQGGGIQGGKVKFKIKGRSLEGVLAKEDRIRSRR